MQNLKEEAYNKAIEVLNKCNSPHGFYAAYPGYQGLWSRDSMITSLGASLLGIDYKESFKNSLINLSKAQSNKGQIPNAILYNRLKTQIDYKSIDSSLWFIIGHYIYKKRYKDNRLFKKYQKEIQKTLLWLSYQDMGEDGMLEQLPTTDWQDAFPHRYGHTINTQALYYKVLQLNKLKNKANFLKIQVNTNKEDKLWGKKFYLSWRWKNHNKYQEKGEWFDSLGNLLAILFDLTDKKKAKSILKYIKDHKIDDPYPIKSIYPPIKPESKEWQPYFLDAESKTPWHYSNAGIWTYIGGFYILVLIKMGMFTEAEKQLTKLAEANLQDPGFTEWLHGKTGKPGKSESSKDGNQAWNAGMYVLAYHSMKNKKVLL